MDAETEPRVRALLAADDARDAAVVAIRAYTPEVLRFLRALLRDEADAADAHAEWAEDVWTGLASWRRESSLRTWILRVARNAALKLKDEAWRRRGRRLQTGEASALADDLRTRSFVRVERQRAALDRLREALTTEDQLLLVLRLDQELSWKEIAEVLAADGEAVDPNTVTQRFARLKERLGRMARERGLIE